MARKAEAKLLPSSSLYHFFFPEITVVLLVYPLTFNPTSKSFTSASALLYTNFFEELRLQTFTSVSKETLDQSSRHPPLKVQFNNLPAFSQRTVVKWVDF